MEQINIIRPMCKGYFLFHYRPLDNNNDPNVYTRVCLVVMKRELLIGDSFGDQMSSAVTRSVSLQELIAAE